MCCQGKERNRISNQIGKRIQNHSYSLLNQNVSKLQIILSLSFRAEKKGKKARKEKKREDDLQQEKNIEL